MSSNCLENVKGEVLRIMEINRVSENVLSYVCLIIIINCFQKISTYRSIHINLQNKSELYGGLALRVAGVS